MRELSLVIPAAHVRPDFVIRTADHILSIEASPWFKVKGFLDKAWLVGRLMTFATRTSGVTRGSIEIISDSKGRVIYHSPHLM